MKKEIVGIFVCTLLIVSISNAIIVTGEKQLYNHDVGVYSINSPIDDGPAQEFTVEVTITNYGLFEECCFNTKVEIGEMVGSTWIIEYEEVLPLPNPPGTIDPGEFVTLTFPDWTPDFLALGITGTKDYKIKACTHLDDPPDQDPSNDCKEVTFTLDFWHDVAVDSIPSPGPCISTGTHSIEAIVVNLGTFPELDLTAYAEILDWLGDPVYNDDITNIDLVVPLGGTIFLSFDDYNFLDAGKYEITICIPLAVDDNPINNCLTVTICVDDGAAPETIPLFNPASPDGDNGWYKGPGPVTVTLTATDNCEVAKTSYSLDGGLTWAEYTAGPPWSFSFPVSGCVKSGDFQYYSEDVCGNVESIKTDLTFKVDTIPPIKLFFISIFGGRINIGFAKDDCSGLDRVDWFAAGTAWPPSTPTTGLFWRVQFFPPPATPVTITVYDKAGNWV